MKQIIETNTKVSVKCTDNIIRKFKVVDYEQTSEEEANYYLKPLGKYKYFDGLTILSLKQMYEMIVVNERMKPY